MDIADLLANAALILPGLLTEKLITALSIRRNRSELEGIILAVVYSFVDIMVALVLQGLLARLTAPMSMLHIEKPVLSIVPMQISLEPAVVLCSAMLVAFVSVLYINRDGHSIFRRLGLTRRHTYTDIWSRCFWNANGSQLRLHLRDGRKLEGRLGEFDDFEEGHVELLEPRVCNAAGEWEEFGGSRLIIDRVSIADVVIREG